MAFLVVSLMVNIVVFGLLPIALLGHGFTMRDTYGPDTAARRTLACVYAALAIVSFAALLTMPILGTTQFIVTIASTILPFQILFIALSRYAIGGGNAVANALTAIAALHTLSLLVYWWP